MHSVNHYPYINNRVSLATITTRLDTHDVKQGTLSTTTQDVLRRASAPLKQAQRTQKTMKKRKETP